MKHIGLVCLFLVSFGVSAESTFIYQTSVEQPLDSVYDRVHKSLEAKRFWVIFEANIGKNLAKNAKHWGEDYNRSELEGIRTMLVCNPWYTNQVSNIDPSLLAMCPLGVTLIHKQGTTTVLFERPSPVAQGSDAQALVKEVEDKVIEAIEAGLSE